MIKLLFSLFLILIHSFFVIYYLGGCFKLQHRITNENLGYEDSKELTKLAYFYLSVSAICGFNLLINLYILGVDLINYYN